MAWLFLLVSLVLFILAAFNVKFADVQLLPLGLAFWVTGELGPLVGHHLTHRD